MFIRYSIKKVLLIFTIIYLANFSAFADTIKNIEVIGNQRISSETIKMFSGLSVNEKSEAVNTNSVLKKIYNSNFFSNVAVVFENNTVYITVEEKPLIMNIEYKGIKQNKLKVNRFSIFLI